MFARPKRWPNQSTCHAVGDSSSVDSSSISLALGLCSSFSSNTGAGSRSGFESHYPFPHRLWGNSLVSFCFHSLRFWPTRLCSCPPHLQGYERCITRTSPARNDHECEAGHALLLVCSFTNLEWLLPTPPLTTSSIPMVSREHISQNSPRPPGPRNTPSNSENHRVSSKTRNQICDADPDMIHRTIQTMEYGRT